jgi:hypothetical protein
VERTVRIPVHQLEVGDVVYKTENTLGKVDNILQVSPRNYSWTHHTNTDLPRNAVVVLTVEHVKTNGAGHKEALYLYPNDQVSIVLNVKNKAVTAATP